MKEIEDIWVFQCKIEFYFIEWTPQAVFSQVAVATSEMNTTSSIFTSGGIHGVHSMK